jgi:FkbM family methyltransferase
MTLHALPDGTEVALIEGDTHISQWVKEAGRLDHDQSTLPILGKYIPLGGMVIDVGAYIGDHTVFYAKAVGPEGAVIAFEPNQRAYDCLLHNTTGLPVRCIHAAASDEYTSIDMVQDRNAGASYAKPGEAIRCARIDDMGLGECHFIKMDCEGM